MIEIREIRRKLDWLRNINATSLLLMDFPFKGSNMPRQYDRGFFRSRDLDERRRHLGFGSAMMDFNISDDEPEFSSSWHDDDEYDFFPRPFMERPKGKSYVTQIKDDLILDEVPRVDDILQTEMDSLDSTTKENLKVLSQNPKIVQLAKEGFTPESAFRALLRFSGNINEARTALTSKTVSNEGTDPNILFRLREWRECLDKIEKVKKSNLQKQEANRRINGAKRNEAKRLSGHNIHDMYQFMSPGSIWK